MPEPTAFICPGVVKPDWIDFNGHMNVGYYGVALDQAGDLFFDHLAIGSAYRQTSGNSFFTVESHLTYQAELLEGEPYEVRQRLIDLSPKAVHFFAAMYRTDGRVAATAEWLHLHIDMTSRRSCPMAPTLLDRLQLVQQEHARLPLPREVGQVIAIRHRPG